MKFGFNFLFWTTYVTDEHLPLFELMKEIGYDGIEIPVGDGEVSHYVDMAQKVRDHGLEVTALAMAMPDADPSSPDPKIRQAGLELPVPNFELRQAERVLLVRVGLRQV